MTQESHIPSVPESHLLDGAQCIYCGDDLMIDYRRVIVPAPIGGFSLSGYQMKFSAKIAYHPWARCVGCGRESKGKCD